MTRHVHGVFAVLVLFSVASCSTVPLPFAAPVLPAELQFVLANEQFFATHDDPLARVIPGTPMDKLTLASLDGCWGAALPEKDGEPALIRLYFALRFDSQTSEITMWALQRDVAGILPFFTVNRGSYEVVDESRLRIRVTQHGVLDPFTAEVKLTAADPPEEGPALATLSGELLNFLQGAENPADVPADELFVVYRRFDCP